MNQLLEPEHPLASADVAPCHVRSLLIHDAIAGIVELFHIEET